MPELNLVELGFEATGLPDGPEVKLRYLQPAVLLKLGLPLVVVRPNVFGGVGWGIEMSCTLEGTDCEDLPIGFQTKSTDPTAMFGADLEIALGPMMSLRADARYLIGLSDIHEASDVWTEVKNRAWIVSGGVAFGF